MKRLGIVFLAVACSLSFVSQAYAYIDPATGSMIVQAVIAVVAAASVTLGIFWSRVRSFLSRFFGRKED